MTKVLSKSQILKKSTKELKDRYFLFFLFYNQEVIYIGRSKNSTTFNLESHKNTKKIDRFSIIELECENEDAFHCCYGDYLVKYQPQWVEHMPKNSKYKTLKDLGRDFACSYWEIKRLLKERGINPVFREYYRVSDFGFGK